MQHGNNILVIHADGKAEKYDMIGVSSPDGNSRIWILANPTVIPRLKVMPSDSKIRISRADFEKIKSAVKLNEETETFLANSVQD
jgi:hypothetical protein